jgi:hypothetical protein
MSWHRPSPPPPQSDPPSVELLRAIGVLQSLSNEQPVSDLNLDAESGISILERWPLINAGVAAGYLDVDEDDAIALTPKGWAWWRKRYADR